MKRIRSSHANAFERRTILKIVSQQRRNLQWQVRCLQFFCLTNAYRTFSRLCRFVVHPPLTSTPPRGISFIESRLGEDKTDFSGVVATLLP
jgi:hypothetical protein